MNELYAEFGYTVYDESDEFYLVKVKPLYFCDELEKLLRIYKNDIKDIFDSMEVANRILNIEEGRKCNGECYHNGHWYRYEEISKIQQDHNLEPYSLKWKKFV